MKIAITGGTGFVGRHFAETLVKQGHSVVLISRGIDRRDLSMLKHPNVTLAAVGLDDVEALKSVMSGCSGVAHCAGINRELGRQTYERVHVQATRNVVRAAQLANVPRIALLSFLRARPDCGSAYHESKWEAEEIVRNSGLVYTILKAGVIYGKGDHLLDHLSHSLHTFSLFGLIGFGDVMLRPVLVQDVVRILIASLVEKRLEGKTVAVTGPDSWTLKAVVQKVADNLRKRVFFIPLPIFIHEMLAWLCEITMKIPLISFAQVRILSENVTDPLPFAEELPNDLKPMTKFDDETVRKGLPPAGSFGLRDLRGFGNSLKDTIIYDGTCGFCRSNVHWIHRLDWLGKFEFVPSQSEDLTQRFPQLKIEAYASAIYLVKQDGCVFTGADALRQVFMKLPLIFWLGWLMWIPSIGYFARRLYPVIAQRRQRISDACGF